MLRRRGQNRSSRTAPATVRIPVAMNDAFMTECIGEHT
jgi:hypothetical protein